MALFFVGYLIAVSSTIAFIVAILTPKWIYPNIAGSTSEQNYRGIFFVDDNTTSCRDFILMYKESVTGCRTPYAIACASLAIAASSLSIILLWLAGAYLYIRRRRLAIHFVSLLAALTMFIFWLTVIIWVVMITMNRENSKIKRENIGFSTWIAVGSSGGFLLAFVLFLLYRIDLGHRSTLVSTLPLEDEIKSSFELSKAFSHVCSSDLDVDQGLCFHPAHNSIPRLLEVRGQETIIPCVLNKPTEHVYWYFRSRYSNTSTWSLIRTLDSNKKELENTNLVTMRNGTNGNYSLILRNLTPIMNGEYNCAVKTDEMTEAAFVVYDLTITAPLLCSERIEYWPCFENQPHVDTVITTPGNSLILPCRVSYAAESNIEWWWISKNSLSLRIFPAYIQVRPTAQRFILNRTISNTSDVTVDMSIVLNHVNVDDSGLYRCVVVPQYEKGPTQILDYYVELTSPRLCQFGYNGAPCFDNMVTSSPAIVGAYKNVAQLPCRVYDYKKFSNIFWVAGDSPNNSLLITHHLAFSDYKGDRLRRLFPFSPNDFSLQIEISDNVNSEKTYSCVIEGTSTYETTWFTYKIQHLNGEQAIITKDEQKMAKLMHQFDVDSKQTIANALQNKNEKKKETTDEQLTTLFSNTQDNRYQNLIFIPVVVQEKNGDSYDISDKSF
ncbi:unnamed protein product [Didymodactylos carnosus]|uniref:Ig-like domain-containing protein n=2 Tax=Didymodactylos carnosus TaxID=1234261 RepID=A0A814BTD4_9BILA|nr:unnamed protein product [Didymodactylos carnosus]CAF3708868.1 unnamed protein product [Didymodactylos carnosus]